MQRSSRRRTASKKSHKEHSSSELFLHGLAGVIGLGILILPIFVSLVYGGVFSIYLVILSGFIALMIGMLIYDVSLTHSHDPYNFLKATSDKEYSFIFGFLLLVAFIITITAAGIASVGEMSLFFGLSVYVAVAVVDAIFLIMWVLFFYNKTRRTLNFVGALKIFFILLLIVVGTVAVSTHGAASSNQSLTFPSYAFAPFSLAIILFLWMFGGFEGAAIVYKGADREKVAKTLIYVIVSAIVLFSIVQLLVYENSSGLSLQAIELNPVSVFTTNVLSSSLSVPIQDVLVGFSILVILTMAFAVINASNRTLDSMAKDGLMPKFLHNDENMKLLITAAVPMALITIFSSIITIVPGALFVYIPIIILSALSFAAAFAFFAIGYAYHYNKSKDYKRVFFGLFVGILLIGLILLVPAAFIIGLVVILIVSMIGYILLR